MPANFDWQTDDESPWPDPPAPRSKPRRRFLWRWLLLVALLLAASGGVVYRQVQARLERTTAVTEADVRASHRLWQQAIESKDAELFNTLLSGRELGWTEGQRALFDLGLVRSRWPLGLEPNGTPVIGEVRLSPDFTAAEVEITQRYAAGANNVTLGHTYVYRRGEQRWLHAPPTDAFWGAWQTDDTRYLTLHYPERDAVISRRLLADLDVQVAHACDALTGLDCPDDLHFSVYFDPDPNSLAELADPAVILRRPSEAGLRLPAPTVAGMPADEAAYQALLRGYAALLVGAAITEGVDYSCCDHGRFYQALLDWQLAQLGLRPYPLNAQTYAQLLDGPTLHLLDMGRLWHARPTPRPAGDNTLRIYSLIDFLLQRDSAPPAAAVLRSLAQSDDYFTWLAPIAGERTGLNLNREWLHFIAANAVQEPQAPLPDQDLLVACKTRSGYNASIVRYDLASSSWTPAFNDRFAVFMQALPGDKGVLLQDRPANAGPLRLMLIRDGMETAVTGLPDGARLFRVDVDGANLVLYAYDRGTATTSFWLLQPDQCDADDCVLGSLLSPPVWSPNGQQTLVVQGGNQIWLGDAQGHMETYLGTGVTPFWVDDETYGFARIRGNFANVVPAVKIAALADGSVLRGVPLATFDVALGQGVSAKDLIVRAATLAPRDPNLLLLVATVYNGARASGLLLLSYDWQTGAADVRYAARHALYLYNPLEFGGNGRYAVIRSYASDAFQSQLVLHDIENAASRVMVATFPGNPQQYDWSADERWLVRVEQGYLELFHPASDYRRIIVHDYAECEFAAWVG